MNLITLTMQEQDGKIRKIKINPSFIISVIGYRPIMRETEKRTMVNSILTLSEVHDIGNYYITESAEEIEKLIRKSTAGGPDA